MSAPMDLILPEEDPYNVDVVKLPYWPLTVSLCRNGNHKLRGWRIINTGNVTHVPGPHPFHIVAYNCYFKTLTAIIMVGDPWRSFNN